MVLVKSTNMIKCAWRQRRLWIWEISNERDRSEIMQRRNMKASAIPNDPDLNATFPRLYVRRKNSISSAQRERVGTLIKPEGGLSFVTLFFLHMKRSDVAASLSLENSVCWLNVDGDKNKMPPVCSDVLIHTVTMFPCTLESPLWKRNHEHTLEKTQT